jgi:hypothetical protein
MKSRRELITLLGGAVPCGRSRRECSSRRGLASRAGVVRIREYYSPEEAAVDE